ncbi:MAG: 16S rRNA (adenine(1518)-N(6)/adenine(1519)-N(6))-dimethyltransferase RsmA [Candidatus Micrarchaeota archaeon]
MSEITPRKELGQNFLTSEEIAIQIAELVPTKGKVLEIGPGLGALTEHLAKRVSDLTVVEIDPQLIEILHRKLPASVEIIHNNCMKEDYSQYDAIVGLLPYNLSSQIIEKFTVSTAKTAVFVIQKELAERVVAPAGTRDYSRFSVLCQNNCNCELIETYPPEVSWPAPQVHSSLVVMKKKKPIALNQQLVNALFQHKNQNVRKALKHSRHLLKIDETKISQTLLEKKVVQLTIQELSEMGKLI